MKNFKKFFISPWPYHSKPSHQRTNSYLERILKGFFSKFEPVNKRIFIKDIVATAKRDISQSETFEKSFYRLQESLRIGL